MDEFHLKRVFRGLVSYSLLSAVAATACGGSTTSSSGDGGVSTGGASTGGASTGGASTGGVGTGGVGTGGVGTGGASTGGAGGVGTGGVGTGGAGGVGTGGVGTGGAGTGGAGTGGDGGVLGPEPFWPDLPLAEFESPTCDAQGNWLAVHGLNPAAPVDYVALRLVTSFGSLPDASTYSEIDSSGTACATASVQVTCQDAAKHAGSGLTLAESCGGPPYACQHYLVTTKGDVVGTYTPGQGYLAFLGPIDTPAEALLVAVQETFGGYYAQCSNPELGSVRAVADGYEVVVTQMVKDCAPIQTDRVLLHVAKDGTVTELRRNIASVSMACVGRRTEGLVSRPDHADTELGAFFASIAHLEDASVDAFLHLRDELRAHGAGSDLLAAALDAARDEVRHARVTGALARRFGATPTEPCVEVMPLRELDVIAAENAAEGCVRETFGALMATYQAATAQDPEVARALAGIADDETRHAALAWRIAAWADPRLSAAERARVRAARAEAVRELRAELDAAVPEVLATVAGVPNRTTALDLLAGLAKTIWS